MPVTRAGEIADERREYEAMARDHLARKVRRLVALCEEPGRLVSSSDGESAFDRGFRPAGFD